ncbi:hypothetical protein [Lentimicrobium sp. S6]|uniref:hypothetical protein n=1 Tax=Lentimicrobium sp. S6 TaxID=2735872 RepID=UPI001557ACF2|nr:hypothetical protein [Lentimicrobium sp. S6]NPD46690.1 hypothetical protein [Lentimicrobium sp. S6]
MKLKTLILCFLIGAMGLLSTVSSAAMVTNPQNEIEKVSEDLENTVKESKSEQAREKTTDWFSLVIAIAYFLGVFILLPLVIYTNMNEKIFIATESHKIELVDGLDEKQCNEKAVEILEGIEAQMSNITDDEGNEFVTITSGKQAVHTKMGLDYINKRLDPSDEDIKNRVTEFTEVYNDRTKRVFTGSKWIIGCAIGIVVLLGIIDISLIFSFFILLHLLGLVFYYLSSKTPLYALEKRLKTFGTLKLGVVGGILTGLFAGFAAKEYVSINGGSWQRDYEGEFNSSMVLVLIIAVVAMFIAFMVALFGIINFLINYSTSFLSPLKKEDKWYAEKYA